MSALTLLSVTAPAVASAPKGPSGDAASGFQNLLAALSGANAPTPQATTGQTALRVPDEGTVEAPTVASFLIPPAPPPTPLILPAVEPSAPDGGSAEGEARTDETASDTAPAPVMGAIEDDRDGRTATTPRPVDKGPISKSGEPEVQPRLVEYTAKSAEPQVQPRLGDIGAVSAPTADIPTTLAAVAAATEAVQVGARVGATPAPPPSSPLPVAAPPAPLRPLADRTSQPLDALTARTGDGTPAIDPARVGAATAATIAAPTAQDQPSRPADFVAAAAGPEAPGGGEAGPAASDLPPLEGAAPQTQAASAMRETVSSQLSRVAIEATAQIAAQILRKLEGRSTRFEMALTPDELGRVDVRLDIDAEGRLNARLAFDNPAAATDLRGRADELRRQLENAGFRLADDALEFAERDSGSSAFDRGQDSRNGPARAFADASRLSADIDVDQPPRWLMLSLSPSGVDMKV